MLGDNRGDEDDFDDSCIQRVRVKIENTFGILKNRRTILKTLNCDVKHTRTIIIAYYVLHNFCRWHIDI